MVGRAQEALGNRRVETKALGQRRKLGGKEGGGAGRETYPLPGGGQGQCGSRLSLHHTGPPLASVLRFLLLLEPHSLPARAKSWGPAVPCSFSLSRG